MFEQFVGMGAKLISIAGPTYTYNYGNYYMFVTTTTLNKYSQSELEQGIHDNIVQILNITFS